VELFSFDEAYLERLRAGDPVYQQHFAAFFGQALLIKLRAKRLPRDQIDEIRQETFVRVLAAIRDGGLRDPACLGAFVCSVCDHILADRFRSPSGPTPLEDHPEIRDQALDMEQSLVSFETQQQVRKALAQLPGKDRKILRAILLGERGRDQLCRDFGVDRAYLRVLLQRAKAHFRALYQKA
jgi:RNA polymerase sigma-70 factor (ECF subfamily)